MDTALLGIFGRQAWGTGNEFSGERRIISQSPMPAPRALSCPQKQRITPMVAETRCTSGPKETSEKSATVLRKMLFKGNAWCLIPLKNKNPQTQQHPT
jgi:hypothetical protein